MPSNEIHGLTIEVILNDNEYKGRQTIHLYVIFLELNDIEHRTTKVGNPRSNIFMVCFIPAFLNAFFRTAFRKNFMNLWTHCRKV